MFLQLEAICTCVETHCWHYWTWNQRASRLNKQYLFKTHFCCIGTLCNWQLNSWLTFPIVYLFHSYHDHKKFFMYLCWSIISELSVGMTTEGIEVRSVGNTKVKSCLDSTSNLYTMIKLFCVFLIVIDWDKRIIFCWGRGWLVVSFLWGDWGRW